LALIAAPVAMPSAAAAPPMPVRTIGGPGHAGLYAWGMAARGGGMLIGDYWNYRVTQWNLDGTPDGDGVLLGERGFGPAQNQTIYGIAVDPTTGHVFTAEADRQLLSMYSPTGQFLKRWGGNGDGPGLFRYPRALAVASDGTLYSTDMWATPTSSPSGWPRRRRMP